MKQDFQCKYCTKKFHKEETLVTHMCVKKQRHVDINSAGSRFGFRAFQRFYEISGNAKKPKSTDDFTGSTFYIDFVKFGNHLHTLKPIHPEQFIDFVIRNGIKLKDWCKDAVYELYISDMVQKEPAVDATDRSIQNMIEWANTNNTDFTQFFNEISANEAAYMISVGKLSPWVLYLSLSGDLLMSKFGEDHSKMMGNIINPGAWAKKFKNNKDDVEYIRTLLEQAGL